MLPKAAAPAGRQRSELTVLHLSDTQFGMHHRFGEGFDSLATRLLRDLASRPDSEQSIDLVIVSGDLTERAAQSEFAQFADFLRELVQGLNIGLDRVVVVPGNHDVNWLLCESYFLQQQARDLPAVAPYIAKWDFFVEFLQDIGQIPEPERLYGVHHFPELGVTVCALNSTMAETHQQHYGFCGEDQLRWFERQLQDRSEPLVIGVVHHNVRRMAENDDENLRDEDALTRLLGERLDVLLHGHTHNGRSDRLSSGTIVLSTGSAAVGAQQRPDEVPNQYQVLTFTTERILRWARRYESDQIRWTADARVGHDSAPGQESFSIGRAQADQAVPGGEVEQPRRVVNDQSPLARQAVPFQSDVQAINRFRASMREDASELVDPSLSAYEFMGRLSLLVDGQPNLVAALLFAERPTAQLPGAQVQCVRYFGKDKTAPRESQNLATDVVSQIESAVDFVRERIERREQPSITSARTEVTYSYPMRCVREVVANAIVHRDYSDASRVIHVSLFDDRLEVASPGHWTGRVVGPVAVPLADLASMSVRRNQQLAGALSLVRYFEGEGSGLPTAVNDSHNSHARQPTVHEADGFVVVTIWPSDLGPLAIQDMYLWARASFGSRETGTGELAASDEPVVASLEVLGRRGRGAPLGSPLTIADARMELLASSGRALLVTGSAGSGKTTLLRNLGSDAAAAQDLLPIRIDARDTRLNARLDQAAIVDAVNRSLGPVATDGRADAVLSAIPTLIVVDALDESPDGVAAWTVALTRFLEVYPLARALTASRTSPPMSTQDGVGWFVWRIQPWTAEQASRFLSSISSSRPDSAGTVVEIPKDVAGVVTSPLLAKLWADVYRGPGVASESRARLFDQAVELSTGGWDRARRIGSGEAFSMKVSRRLVARVAAAAFVTDLGWSAIPLSFAQSVLEEMAGEEASGLDLARSSTLLSFDAQTRELSFTNGALAAYLAAEGLLFSPLNGDELSAWAELESAEDVLPWVAELGIAAGGGSVVTSALTAALAMSLSASGRQALIKAALAALGTSAVAPQDRDELEQAVQRPG